MNRTTRRRQGDRGIGLAECAAALLVLAAGALAGMGLVALSVQAGDRLQRDAAAHTLLAGRLEALAACSFDDPALDPGGSLSEPQGGFSETVTIDGRVLVLCRRVTLESPGRKLVSVGLLPRDGRPGARLSAWVVR